MTSHNREWKNKKREEIKKLVDEYPFIAIVTLQELPANIASSLRKKLKGEAEIVVAKTRVIQKAFEEANTDTSKLNPLVDKNVAIIFSKKNPFELYSFIKRNKGNTSAKAGDIAEDEIVVKAGDTGLPPGPALTELKSAGLKVQVQGPTISISKDKVVAKKGDEITAPVADVLGKLDMKPMKVGMQVMGVFDKNDDQFYKADVLDVDEEELFNKFVSAYKHALNLSVEAGYFNEESTEVIIVKAEREAKAVDSAVKNVSQEETTSEKQELTGSEEEKEKQEESKEEPKEQENKDEVSSTENVETVEQKQESQSENQVSDSDKTVKNDNSQAVDKQEVEEIAEQATDSAKIEENKSEDEKDSDDKKVEEKK